ncbi:MAG: methylated-DNA--[protein]-cysteine S-methyltransferase [Chloroflexota bacterium]
MTILPPNVYQGIVETPVGSVRFALTSAGLVTVNLGGEEAQFLADVKRRTKADPMTSDAKTAHIKQQIKAYFQDNLQIFDMHIDWSIMTPFQSRVLKRVASIPYGRYLTYKDIAHEIGQPKAARAVGRANATNPIPLIIPCHRVLGSDGKLHGFAAPGGIETKAWLLKHEGSWLL